MKNHGNLHYFFGIEASRTSNSLFLSQTKYVTYLLSKAKLLVAKPCATPYSTTKNDTICGDLLNDPNLYISL
ncbi:PREDICTED: poly, partial [Prunus dulcis]